MSICSTFFILFLFLSALMCLINCQQTQSPTYPPTSSPTTTPSPVPATAHSFSTIALHQIISIKSSGSQLIRLSSFDTSGQKIYYRINSLPLSGTLRQLSQVFSSYGYEPVGGSLIQIDSVVSGSNNRVLYSRPSPDVQNTFDKWDEFSFTAFSINATSGVISSSFLATITLVPQSGSLVGSDFLLNASGWSVYGNKIVVPASFEPYTRGPLLNHYIVGSDELINIEQSGATDQSLWYFEAPSKFSGNLGIAYGGELQFILGAFSGDFSRLNDDSVNVVLLECATCQGPVTMGITLGFSIASLRSSASGMFFGTMKRFSIPLLEAVWKKDSQNSLTAWTVASRCDVIQVLSRLSRVRILGDWTTMQENIALDDVRIVNTKGRIPLCAAARPDASICTC